MIALGTPPLETKRLDLVPLQVGDAEEMVDVLADPDLYEFTGGTPPNRRHLETRFAAQVKGPATLGEVWHNWILRLRDSNRAIGFVQATVTAPTADVAWVVGTEWQRRGFATEAATAMCRWLAATGIAHLTAHIHPDHVGSQRVAQAAGMKATDVIDADGEIVWETT